MQSVRKIIESDLLLKIIDVPKELQHKKIELIILPLNEKMNVEKFNPDDYRGILKENNLEEELEHLRNEWDRI